MPFSLRGIDRRERGAGAAGGEPAGVAVGHQPHRAGAAGGEVADQRQAVAANGVAGCGVVGTDRLGLGPGGLDSACCGGSGRRAASMRASAQCRLTAVGRVAPSTFTARARALVVTAFVAQRQGHAEGRGGADQRRTAHLHAADGVRGVGQMVCRSGSV
jgi:hypothetical protein